jgi:hypothetical protein
MYKDATPTTNYESDVGSSVHASRVFRNGDWKFGKVNCITDLSYLGRSVLLGTVSAFVEDGKPVPGKKQ